METSIYLIYDITRRCPFLGHSKWKYTIICLFELWGPFIWVVSNPFLTKVNGHFSYSWWDPRCSFVNRTIPKAGPIWVTSPLSISIYNSQRCHPNDDFTLSKYSVASNQYSNCVDFALKRVRMSKPHLHLWNSRQAATLARNRKQELC